jgi:hypothetical protein
MITRRPGSPAERRSHSVGVNREQRAGRIAATFGSGPLRGAAQGPSCLAYLRLDVAGPLVENLNDSRWIT